MSSTKTATWNREDRDLLVELRTNMAAMAKQLVSMDMTMKEIHAGYSSRLLALEGNAVSKIQFDLLQTRVEALEDSRIEYRATLKAWFIMIGIAQFVFTTALAFYFHFY